MTRSNNNHPADSSNLRIESNKAYSCKTLRSNESMIDSIHFIRRIGIESNRIEP